VETGEREKFRERKKIDWIDLFGTMGRKGGLSKSHLIHGRQDISALRVGTVKTTSPISGDDGNHLSALRRGIHEEGQMESRRNERSL